MKIAVCMKQVPKTSEGEMDKKTGVLIRSGLESIVNIYDLAALEAALQIREKSGGEIHVFTMGPEKALAVLREAYALGADEGYLICDRVFGGADVLATSYTLMQAIKAAGTYDLILCGKQTTDGDTAQVSGALAKWMDLPHINWVRQISVNEGNSVRVEYNMENRIVTAEVERPCLLSVEKEHFVPRMPSLKLKIRGKKKAVHRITLGELADKEAEHYGLAGSATRVKKIFPPKRTNRHEVLKKAPEEAAAYILSVLREEGRKEML